jgi:hypothetical protein
MPDVETRFAPAFALITIVDLRVTRRTSLPAKTTTSARDDRKI